MATQSNEKVISAMNALVFYGHILCKMFNEETEYRNQFSLQYMIELNEHMITILEQFEYSKTGLETLPDFLRVDIKHLDQFYQNLNNIIDNDRNLVRLVKSQNIRWENLISSVAALPFDFIKEFINGLGFSLRILCESTAILCLMIIPELVPAVLIVAALGGGAYGIGRALFSFYNNMTPTYAREGFAPLSSAQQSAIEDLIEFNKTEFSTSIKSTKEDNFASIHVLGSQRSARQGFFSKPSGRSNGYESLAEEAASKFELVSSCMQI